MSGLELLVDVWTQVNIQDMELCQRWVNVIRPMNRDYHALSINQLRRWMQAGRGETWYFPGASFAIALRFQYIPKRNRYQLANVGFTGQITPQCALDLVVEKCQEFLGRQEAHSLFGLRPKHMLHPGIEAFHQLVPHDPRLNVTVEHDAPGMIMWNIKYREPVAAQAFC